MNFWDECTEFLDGEQIVLDEPSPACHYGMFEDSLSLFCSHSWKGLEDGSGFGFPFRFEELGYIRTVSRTVMHPSVSGYD